ncbi:large ribosomal subunit protein mL45 isoform X2 [Antennarius striatus]|uniref:large ribosomal subunit protein mL45 isoform X2 n=1 Tax=Antennarius striatus TaxID=241820 RepID=UPI0035B3D977
MAVPLRRLGLGLHRATCFVSKNAEGFPDVCLPIPFFLPVRTKRKRDIPPGIRQKKAVDDDQKIAARAKAAGIMLEQKLMERTINIACSEKIFDPYIPPEGDARISLLSKEGMKQRSVQFRQTATSRMSFRKIKANDSWFNTKDFAEYAQETFIKAHNCLTQFNKQELRLLVTERCYPEMTRGNRYKTIRWAFVESIEPPRIVHARISDMVSKQNLYGQTLAIYDRFGRLILGNEERSKDVLEYLVMERHLTNPYSQWRLHGKIVPAWAPAKDPIIKTVMITGPKLSPGEEFDALNYSVPKPIPVQWNK